MKNLVLAAICLLPLVAYGGTPTLGNPLFQIGAGVTRRVTNSAADHQNIKNSGALINGASGDATTIQNIYNSLPANSVVAVPDASQWPGSFTANPSKFEMWLALGRFDLSGSSAGTNPVQYVGDGDLLQEYQNGTLVFSQRWINNPDSRNMLALNLTVDRTVVQSGDYNTPLAINTTTTARNGSSTGNSRSNTVAVQSKFYSGGTNGFGSFDVGDSQQVFRTGTNWIWSGVFNSQDLSGAPATISLNNQMYGTETDVRANGPDLASALYDPQTSMRIGILMNAFTQTWPARAANTPYALNAIISATGTDGTIYIYKATAAGTSGGGAVTWPTIGTVTDGGVRWTEMTTLASTFGVAMNIISTDGGGGNAYWGTGLAMRGRFQNAGIDLTGVIPSTATTASVRLATGGAIDFTGVAGANSPASQDSNVLYYNNGGFNFASYGNQVLQVKSSGALNVPGTLAIGFGTFGANLANQSTGYPAQGLTIGTNYSNANQESDLISGPNGYAFFEAKGGAITTPDLTIKAGVVAAPKALVVPFATPVSSSAACVQGQLEEDASYTYDCVAANTWKRAAVSSF